MAMQGQTSASKATEPMDLDDVQTKAMEGLQEVRGTVEEFARNNPRTAVAVALGLGFVLGGGLTPRILFGVGAIAARRYAKDFARAQIGSITRGALGMSDDGGSTRKTSGASSSSSRSTASSSKDTASSSKE